MTKARVKDRVMVVMNIRLKTNTDADTADRNMFVGEAGTIKEAKDGRTYAYLIEFDNKDKVELSRARGHKWVWCDDEIMIL